MRRQLSVFVMLSVASWVVSSGAAPASVEAPSAGRPEAEPNPGGETTPAAAIPAVQNPGDAPRPETVPVATLAEERFAAARELYQAGDLRGALRELLACYELSRANNLLFNIGQLYRELGDCSSAVDYYERYLKQVPQGERTADAQRHLDSLRPRCRRATARGESPRPAPPAPRAVPVPQPLGDNHWSTVGWVALGLGAAATAGAVYASVETIEARRDVEHPETNDQGLVDGGYVAERQDDFFRDRNWAFVLGSTAVLATGFGFYALFVAGPPKTDVASAWSTSFSPRSVSVDYRCRF